MKGKDIEENPFVSNVAASRKEIWSDMRTIQQPAFNPQAVLKYFEGIMSAVQGGVQDIHIAYQHKKEVDIFQMSKLVTTAALMDAAFGMRLDL